MSSERLGYFKNVRYNSALIIILAEMCERLGYYSVNTNFVLYLRENSSLSNNSIQVFQNAFIFLCYFFSIVGGTVADTKYNKLRTILLSLSVYIVGSIFLFLSTWNYYFDNEIYFLLIYLGGLLVLSVGCGGIKPNVSTLAADQFNIEVPKEVEDKDKFFNLFYLVINVGALFISIFVGYLAQNISFILAFGIAPVALTSAFLILFFRRKKLIIIVNDYSPNIVMINHLIYRIKKRFNINSQSNNDFIPIDNDIDNDSTINNDQYCECTKTEKEGIFHQKLFSQISSLKKMFFMMFISIIFNFAYNRVWFISNYQALQMNLNLFGLVAPISALNFPDPIAVIIGIFFIFNFLLPRIEKKYNWKPSPKLLMSFGFFLLMISLVYLGVLEIIRLHLYDMGRVLPKSQSPWLSHHQKNNFVAVDLSCAWLFPAFYILGTAEIFTFLGMIKFWYYESHPSIRCFSASIGLFANGLSSIFDTIVVILISLLSKSIFGVSWFSADINHSRYDLISFFVVFMLFLAFIILMLFFMIFKSTKHLNELESNKMQKSNEDNINLIKKSKVDIESNS